MINHNPHICGSLTNIPYLSAFQGMYQDVFWEHDNQIRFATAQESCGSHFHSMQNGMEQLPGNFWLKCFFFLRHLNTHPLKFKTALCPREEKSSERLGNRIVLVLSVASLPLWMRCWTHIVKEKINGRVFLHHIIEVGQKEELSEFQNWKPW